MKENVFNKEAFIEDVKENVKNLYRKTLDEASQQEIFQAVSYTVKDVIIDDWLATQKAFDKQDPKMVYYMSMEFLMGRALGNNMINLKMYKEVKEALGEIGLNLDEIEDQEPDPALGNGGLGRLAACFMESLATLGYAAYGCGIRYRYGMFKQKIKDGFQVEVPDNWLKNGYPFELRRPEYSYEVKFGGYVRAEVTEEGKTRFVQENYQSVKAVPYDIPVVGYGNHIVNTLCIWDAEAINTFNPLKNIKLATYASRCIENEILMFLRRNNKVKYEVSIDEPLNVDWDGNELLLSDILGTDEDVISRRLEDEVEISLLSKAIRKLSPREQTIIRLRFGLGKENAAEKTQKEVADLLGISQSYISRLEKRIMKRLKKEIVKYE